jgi:probable phosphoglycerate mutase
VTTVLLIRHAHTEAIGQRLSGRSPGVPLSAAGAVQADRLGRSLAAAPLAAIYSSPLERAVDTARAIAHYQPVSIRVCDALSEIDFGDWTGKSFAELADDPEWHTFNTCRSTAVIPHGESPIAVQQRIVAAVERLAALHPSQTIAIVSHADVLRSAVLHYAATPLDLYDRFEISPASITALTLSVDGPRLLYVNNSAFACQRSAPV